MACNTLVAKRVVKLRARVFTSCNDANGFT